MQEIILHEATERVHQIETTCRLLEVYPNEITDADISVLTSLLARLLGNVASSLIEEESKLVGDQMNTEWEVLFKLLACAESSLTLSNLARTILNTWPDCINDNEDANIAYGLLLLIDESAEKLSDVINSALLSNKPS